MRILALTLLTIFSVGASAEVGLLEVRTKKTQQENFKDKKWQMTVGVDFLQYPATLPSYKGTHETIKSEQNEDIYGLALGLGRSFDITGGLSTSLKFGGFYNRTVDGTDGKASEDLDLDVASIRNSHMVYGGEVSASLNYLFENKTIHIQPFAEIGYGRGISSIEREYNYVGIASSSSPDAENYDIKAEEGFGYIKSTLGVNFISNSGLVSYIKASNMALNVNQRETTGSISDGSGTQNKDDKEKGLSEAKSIFSASLGIGFLF